MPESPTLLWRIKLLFLAEILPKKPHRIVHLPRPPSLASYLASNRHLFFKTHVCVIHHGGEGTRPPSPI